MTSFLVSSIVNPSSSDSISYYHSTLPAASQLLILHPPLREASTSTSPPIISPTTPAILIMPSAALHQKFSTMQNEADLLAEHARVLSTFASELSSFASNLSYQSHEYCDQSDELNRAAGRIMAVGPAMESDSTSGTEYQVVVARVTREVAHAAETTDVRDAVRRTLHSLTSMLAGQSPEIGYERSRFLKRKRSSIETWQGQLGCSYHLIRQEKVECEDAMHTLKRYRHTTDSFASPFPQSETEAGSTSDRSEALPAMAPDWKTWCKSWVDEDESADWPVNKASGKSSDKSSESDETEIYSPDLPSYEEAMITLDPVKMECDTVGEFLRNPYSLATRTGGLGKPPVPRPLVLEAAERTSNPNLASGPLFNCAAAFL